MRARSGCPSRQPPDVRRAAAPAPGGDRTVAAPRAGSTPVDRVRMGIVGVGNIAPLNVAGYLEHERCDVVALCDPREDKVRQMAAEWDVPTVYTSLDDLLADDQVDAVEILTPTHLH